MSDIKFKCIGCGIELQAPEELLDVFIRCDSCNTKQQVTRSAEVDLDLLAEAPVQKRPQNKKAQNKTKAKFKKAPNRKVTSKKTTRKTTKRTKQKNWLPTFICLAAFAGAAYWLSIRINQPNDTSTSSPKTQVADAGAMKAVSSNNAESPQQPLAADLKTPSSRDNQLDDTSTSSPKAQDATIAGAMKAVSNNNAESPQQPLAADLKTPSSRDNQLNDTGTSSPKAQDATIAGAMKAVSSNIVDSPQQPLAADLKIPSSVEPFFKNYCYSCHDEFSEKGDLNLEDLSRKITNTTDAQHWQDILDQMNSGEMPPKISKSKKKVKQPSKGELSAAIGELTEVLFEAEATLKDSGGEIALRRLNRREYQATIKDLMGIKFKMFKLPEDASGRFDTIGQNQSLSSMQLQKYFSFNREIAKTSLFWAVKPRKKTSITKVDGANKEKREKRIYEVIKLVKQIKKTGEDYRDLGISDAEWKLHNPGTAHYKKRDTYAQYYIKNVDYHSKGRMMPMHNLVNSLGVHFDRDARGDYRLRVSGGVVDGVKIRRNVRLMIPHLGRGGVHGKAIGSFFITGSIDKPSIHEMFFQPENDISFKPNSKKKARQSVSLFEDVSGGMPYHRYKTIEPQAPIETIMVKWASAEGPIYAPKSPFELLVEKYKVASSADNKLDLIARQFLVEFASSAFRGNQASKEFIDRLADYYHKKRKEGKGFKEAIIDPLAMILSSTKFLYLLEHSEKKLDALSLANRLSYFLWSSAPDAKLMKLAESGAILKQDVLKSEVDRMLASSKAESFYSGFMSQWLHLKRFDELSLPSQLFLHRSDAMILSSKREPVEFFKTLVSEDLCVSNIIDSDFVMANGTLAMKYGLSKHYKGDGFQKLKLPEDSPRGGVMTQAAFLSMGTMGNRTSPVIRGALVKEILLNDPPPPPPPNVPELVHKGVDPLASVRSLVVLHQQKPQCASCHARFDFIGLGLENFGPIGLWRNKEVVSQATSAQKLAKAKKKVYAVDASGKLQDGTKFKDLFELKKALMKQKRQVADSLLEGLLSYALGRDISFTDRPLIRRVLNDLEKKKRNHRGSKVYAVKEMVKQVVSSQAFLEN